MELSEQDRALLKLLQQDSHISNQELAKETAMSTSVCWRRVRALEESGVIKRYTALVDASKAGLSFHAVIHLHLTEHSADNLSNFITAVEGRAEVLDCFATTGDSDYYLRVRCKDLNAYNAFLDDFIFKLPSIANVRTNLILKEIKHETVLNI